MITQAIFDENNTLKDIEISIGSRKIFLLGNRGEEREISLLNQYDKRDKKNVLPVFLGLGFGYAVRKFLELSDESQQICIIDKENFLENEEYHKTVKDILENPRVIFIQSEDVVKALSLVTAWQNSNKNFPLFPILNSQYTRMDSDYYKKLKEKLEASFKFDFWGKVRKKRFVGENPKLLLLTSKYFLMGEIVSACKRIGLEHKLVILEDEKILQEEFVSKLLQEVVEFQPDAILTMNHLGVDREGILTDLLARLELPLVSWFVDNPHLVLHSYPKLSCEWLNIFTYDKDNIVSLNKVGYENVHYLPLGTDPERFNPRNAEKPYRKEWVSNVSFVGNSMRTKVASALGRAQIPRDLLIYYKEIARKFIEYDGHSVYNCLEIHFPNLLPLYHNLKNIENKLAFETAITWEATRLYRYLCFEQCFDFDPLVVGDSAWIHALNKRKVKYRYISAVSYYDELPQFYCHSKINFNSTSQQMKNAVNQRIFDVTATNSFIITDWRAQMDDLLESGKEVVSYKEKEEIPDLIRFYLKNETARKEITNKGRERVLQEHTWEKRLEQAISTLKKKYA